MTKCTIGLTGGIGSGKSLAADMFKALGACIIDTDQIAREIVKPGQQAYLAIADHFGPTVLKEDKTLNRAKLRHIIFNDPAEKKHLESILHPLIRTQTQTAIQDCQTAYCIIVVPLLIENKVHYKFINRILLIDCDESLQCQRASQRDQLPIADIEHIIEQQASREERLKAADDVLDNSGTPDDLLKQVKALHEQYIK